MARLNEAPCSNESVDALKRRFIRQNRELAKNNSSQSVRIRCLESEISRLLTENLNLRDEILQLRNDLEGAPNKRTFGGVKTQLEEQVQILAKLVAGIGISQEQDKEKNNNEEKPSMRFPTVGWGRGMADPMDGSDGRLPAIREDKMYPRRTLECVVLNVWRDDVLMKDSAQEIQTVAEANSESPVLGSPPVSHFRDEEPIQFDKPTDIEIKKESEEENHESLPVNLETRRKKRDSNTKLSIRRMSVFSSPEDETDSTEKTKQSATNAPIPPLKTGAKRKLSSRDEEVKSGDDFTFSRKGSSGSGSADESSAKEDKIREPIKSAQRRDFARAPSVKLSERKALGEKNVNIDPAVSPKKTAKKSTIQEEKEALKKTVEATKEAIKPRVRDRKSRVAMEESITVIPQHEQAPLVAEITPSETKTELPPKTPATVAEIFSAPSTEDSTRREAGRDTPPPADLTSSTDANGRPGRRARTQVNYAEPSLAAKMRRPTKELLDAVGKDGRPLSGMIVKKGVAFKLEGSDGMSSSTWKYTDQSVKLEEGQEIAEPGSPLSKKSTTSTEPIQGFIQTAEPQSIIPSAASQAIAQLLKDSKTTAAKRRTSAAMLRQGPPRVDSDTDNEARKDKRGSSIYDFASSSPPKSSHPTMPTSSRPSSRTEERPNSRTSRRHSSMANLNTAASKEASGVEPVKAPTRFGAGVAGAGHKRSVSGTVRQSAIISESAGAAGEKTDLRGSRRRSMML